MTSGHVFWLSATGDADSLMPGCAACPAAYEGHEDQGGWTGFRQLDVTTADDVSTEDFALPGPSRAEDESDNDSATSGQEVAQVEADEDGRAEQMRPFKIEVHHLALM